MADAGVVLSSPRRLALEEIRVDPPGPGEVLVRIEATGVCHSDLHVIDEDGWGHPFPVLLGHEGAGTVEAVGDGRRRSRPQATASCSAGRRRAAPAPRVCAASHGAAGTRPPRPDGCTAPTAPC